MSDILPAIEEKRWELLENIEPWGQKREDLRTALVCYTIACCNFSGKGKKPMIKDFLKFLQTEEYKDEDDWLNNIG